ncbi:MAG TPA: hypothetical protein PKL48_03965 [Thermodesulfobacteriota bacterium]|nr:hypothetical protein [Thermodesulfobacteriota bacterium]
MEAGLDIGKFVAGSEGVWHHFKGPIEFCLRPLAPKKLRELRKLATVRKWKRHQMMEDVDDDKLEELLNDWMIENWRGLTKNGQEFPCTTENRKYVMDYCPEISTFIKQMTLITGTVEEEAMEDDLKNS